MDEDVPNDHAPQNFSISKRHLCPSKSGRIDFVRPSWKHQAVGFDRKYLYLGIGIYFLYFFSTKVPKGKLIENFDGTGSGW